MSKLTEHNYQSMLRQSARLAFLTIASQRSKAKTLLSFRLAHETKGNSRIVLDTPLFYPLVTSDTESKLAGVHSIQRCFHFPQAMMRRIHVAVLHSTQLFKRRQSVTLNVVRFVRGC